MTIKIERDAFPHVFGASHPPPTTALEKRTKDFSISLDRIRHEAAHDTAYSSASLDREQNRGEEDEFFYNPFLRKPSHPSHDPVKVVDSVPELEDTDDDCTTVSSCSTGSTESSRSSWSPRPVSVRFAHPLVTEVRCRPRTRPRNVSKLFYSCDDIQRFRQRYRKERKLEQDKDDSITASAEGLEPDTSKSKTSDNNESCSQPNVCNTMGSTTPTSKAISRVVIFHNETQETFINKDNELSPLTPLDVQGQGEIKEADGNFFDNESFWTGKIKWY